MNASQAQPIIASTIGFMRHLRLNGFSIGPDDTALALRTLRDFGAVSQQAARQSLKILLARQREEWSRFDELFEAYWLARGAVRSGLAVTKEKADTIPPIWSRELPQSHPPESQPDKAAHPRDSVVPAAQRKSALVAADLRHIADPGEIALAEQMAIRLARAMRYRLSRRFHFDNAGRRLDLRRTIRRNIGHGGTLIQLSYKERPERPVEIVLLVDVSGSMKPYSRFFLQFAKGLVSGWAKSDAYLLHTRLVRVSDALRERDPLVALTRLSLLAEGFGGGTRLGECLHQFNRLYAKRALNSRSVVIIISDGYDTDPPQQVAHELDHLKKRARLLVWLNPLLGWQEYQPINRAMQAAMPYIDHFAAAHSLEALAAVESDLRHL